MTNESQLAHQTRSVGRDPTLPRLLGDVLCLDYTNTVDDRTGENRTETLFESADLVRWAWHAGIIEESTRATLLGVTSTEIVHGEEVFRAAIDLREAIYCIFSAIAANAPVDPSATDLLQRHYHRGLGQAKLVPTSDPLHWHWSEPIDITRLDTILWPIAQSGVDLLLSDQLHRVKQCPGCDDCGWLFLDTSKNGTRRWCSMEGCGSRAKMRRLYARRKTG